jgi:molybdate transport system ATP-binding protein
MKLIVDIKKKLGKFNLSIMFDTTEDPLAVLGASGSGKSMLLKCIAGIEKPDKGKIILNDRVLLDSEKHINLPIKKRKVGFLFQNYALFPHMNVKENIGFAIENKRGTEKNLFIQEIIKNMQLDGFENRYPSQLSGGQQQRVALARVLATEPEILLLDEPFSALDNYLRGQMEKQMIQVLSKYRGITLFVTHNVDEAYRICKNLIIISNGSNIATGNKEEIFVNPPNMTTARLTGCKNFSNINFVQNNFDEDVNGIVEAVDWGCVLNIDKNRDFKPGVKYCLGIRANHIVLAEEHMKNNLLRCSVIGKSETPFRVTVYLKPDNESQGELLWEMSKEKWTKIKDKTSYDIFMDPKRIFIVSDE